jgi:hypothetical protein
MMASMDRGGLVSPVLFSLYVKGMSTPSRHVDLALYADDGSDNNVLQSTASRQASRVLCHWTRALDTGFEDCYQCLEEHRSTICLDHEMRPKTQAIPASRRGNTMGRNSKIPWGNPWHTAYLVGSRQPPKKEGGSKIGYAWPLPKQEFYGVLLNKQLIRPMMDYGCPNWRSAAHTHINKLQVLQSKCLGIAINASWYVGNKQIHEDLGIPFFADHIRALSDSSDSKLADAAKSLVLQLGKHLCQPWAGWSHPRVTEEGWRPAEESILPLKTAKSTQRLV